jgi:hypothetical protein
MLKGGTFSVFSKVKCPTITIPNNFSIYPTIYLLP